MPVYYTNNEKQTIQIAAKLAKSCRGGEIFLLHGTLGAGKSLFARGFIQALMDADTEVPSPTFTLLQTYDSPLGTIWHFDLYRIQDPEEIFEIGWEDATDGSGITLAEWPERAVPYLPKKARNIQIKITDNGGREISIDE
jgi:tRNA threonylcarbamoyladenosine biosynthesis protein TsaE